MSRTSVIWLSVLVGVVLLLSACLAPASPQPAATAAKEGGPTPSRQALPQIEVGGRGTPSPQASPQPTPEGTVWNPRAIATQVQLALADLLNVTPKDVPFVTYESEVDPATLTCVDQLVGDIPTFGEGEALVFQYKETKFYVVSSQDALWVCRSGPLTAGESLTLDKAKEKAIEDLAQRLGIPKERIQVVEAKEVTWDDTSLGCPVEGQKYAQILTPGFLVVLKVGEQTYAYHGSSRKIFLCGEETKK